MGAHNEVRLPTGVVTVLLADVEGSVRGWEANPDAMAAGMASADRLVSSAIAAHDGVRPVEQGEGDSFVAAFVQPADAVACALAIQRGLVAQLTHVHQTPVRMRMAIHTDQAKLRDPGNYAGALMNRAARLRALAHGGQVLVSGVTRELVSEALPEAATLADLGTHRLRDLPTPQRVWQLQHADLDADFPPLRSPDARLTNLPPQLTTFVGRLNELQIVRKLLHENRLVTLTGPGGTGKTRLAIELAADAFDAYAGGAWFVDLGAVSEPSAVATAVARALHLRDEAVRDPIQQITTHFDTDQVVLVLDNCEQVVGAAAALVDALLRACPNLDVIITSREPLCVGGEATYVVPPLALPDHSGADASTLADYDAVRLFADRAYRGDPEFTLDEATTRTVAAICERVDALPLAIELAASRVRVMPLETIAAELAERFDLLVGGARTSHPRQQSLLACVEWSHALLDERERALFRRLAAFTDSFTFGAVQAVCVGGALDGAAAADVLLALVDKSLVARAAPGRYRLLSTIQEFAADRLAESDDDIDELRHRHLAHLVDLAERTEQLTGRSHERAVDELQAEATQIGALIEWAGIAAPAAALRLAAALVPVSFASGNLLRGWRWLAPLLSEVESLDDRSVRAKAEIGAGLLVLFCGEMAVGAAAPAHLTEAARLYEELGDRAGHARAKGLLAIMMMAMGQRELARPQWEASVATLREEGDSVWVTMLTMSWGAFLVQHGRPRDGMAHLEEARRLAEALDNQRMVGFVTTWMAAAHSMFGEYERARVLAHEVLDNSRAAEARGRIDPDNGSFMSFVVGDAYFHLGDLDAAEHYALASARAGARHNIRAHEALGCSLLGRVAMEHGNPERAHASFRRAFELAGTLGHPIFVARHAPGLAGALEALGRVEEARETIARGLDAARQVGPSADLVRLLLTNARLDRAGSRDATAEDQVHEALSVSVAMGSRGLAIAALEAAADLAAGVASDAEATRLLAAAHSLRAELGRREGNTKQLLDLARERLGDEAFERAWGEGAAMSLEEATAYAARGRGSRKRPTSGWASLTPTELEVVRLVSEGLTNPQIGERMFISKGTVRTHVSHVFAKLGVTSRSQLAAEATRRASAG